MLARDKRDAVSVGSHGHFGGIPDYGWRRVSDRKIPLISIGNAKALADEIRADEKRKEHSPT